MEHIPGPRKADKLLPIVLLISGESYSGKSTVSYFLNKSDNIKYFSLDTFTLDKDVPIPSLNYQVKKMGKEAAQNIHKLEEHVMQSMSIFIEYCYDNIVKLNYDIFIFDGVYFNNTLFLEAFKTKFNKEYKIWLMSPNF
jgi:adenylate kinase family enzyme